MTQRDVMQQALDALDALEWVNDNCPGEMPIVDEALFDLRAELAKPAAGADGWVMVPKRLTAENGAKAALIGDFSVPYQTSCPECEGLDEDVGGCSTCNGDGSIRQELSISWPTIKNIWAKGIEHFAAAPQPPAPAVDVEAVREVAAFLNDYSECFPDEQDWQKTLGAKLARAIGDKNDV